MQRHDGATELPERETRTASSTRRHIDLRPHFPQETTFDDGGEDERDEASRDEGASNDGAAPGRLQHDGRRCKLLCEEILQSVEGVAPQKDLGASEAGCGAQDGQPVGERVEDAACSRYLGLSIDGAANGPSPDWLRALLLAVGQRPLDLFVDLSNFVMLDLGQPNHAFDRDRLDAGGIVVRRARAGERMTTLDGEDRGLEESDLLITSGEQPVALAGVMGGEGSKVVEGTSRLLLECAPFDATTVRRTSARLAHRTDSSARFEKTLDPTLPVQAAAHYAHLLQALQPGVTFPAALSDDGDWSDPSRTIRLRTDVVRRDLGIELADDAIASILTRLDLAPTPAEGGFDVALPAARAAKDLTMERDLVEEGGRIHRYGSVPEAPLGGAVVPPPCDRRRALVRAAEDRLAGAARFHQVLSYSVQADDLLANSTADQGPFPDAGSPTIVVSDTGAERDSVFRSKGDDAYHIDYRSMALRVEALADFVERWANEPVRSR